ncbi:MAG: response regulator transcription factor [Gammaproteobacteria bacterium]|nr:response regulator transcription factor [Gammaproteobacteria bacterium]
MKSKILIIEDESRYAYILEKYFTNDGFEVRLAFDGLAGFREFKIFDPDVIVLDIMLPKMDGYEVAKKIREDKDTPIIMVSALAEEQDILKGYTLKIDDYVTKPFRIPILIAKAKNLIERRRSIKENDERNELQIGSVRIVRDIYECYINDELIKLTKTEFKLLEYLMLNAGKTCTREQLLIILWGDKDIEERIIDTYIKKIRKILGEENATITTIFGIGYRFEKEPKKD